MLSRFSSVQFSRSVVSGSLRPPDLQHARPPCPSPTPWVHPNPCPLCWWCYPAISFSVVPFSSCLQSFPASGSLPMSQFFTSGGQSIGTLASASGLPMNIQDWSPLGWTGWISLRSKVKLSRVFSTLWFKSINSSELSFLYSPTLTSIHDHWENHMRLLKSILSVSNGASNRILASGSVRGLREPSAGWPQPSLPCGVGKKKKKKNSGFREGENDVNKCCFGLPNKAWTQDLMVSNYF